MAIILLSGGLDSAVNLALAAKAKRATLALTMRYGQRAEAPELKAASELARHYGVEWRDVDMRWLGAINTTGLTRSDQILPQLKTEELDSMNRAMPSMRAVWVANRNGVFLNIAASFAEALGQREVVVGFNREEAATFPDNSAAFLEATNHAFSYSTLNAVQVLSYTTDWDKTRILKEALALELPLDLVWSCYEAGPERCWSCESCKRSERALLSGGEAGLSWLRRMGWKK
jgi:7-cyano-7-deazaguanine synthase